MTTTAESHVLAVDVTTSSAYFGAVYADGRTPQVRLHKFDPLTEADHSTERAAQIAESNAKRVVSHVVKGTIPELVVMNKLILTDLKSDPTGPRRAALWWNVVQKFVAVGIPVGEVSPMTAQKILTGRSNLGIKGFHDSATEIKRLFPDIEDIKGFRYYTVGEAMLGAIALGWTTPVAVTASTIKLLHGQSVSFPAAVQVPATGTDWYALNERFKDLYTGSVTPELV